MSGNCEPLVDRQKSQPSSLSSQQSSLANRCLRLFSPPARPGLTKSQRSPSDDRIETIEHDQTDLRATAVSPKEKLGFLFNTLKPSAFVQEATKRFDGDYAPKCYTVLYNKLSYSKPSSVFDGVLLVEKITKLFDSGSKIVTQRPTTLQMKALKTGDTVIISNLEIEVQEELRYSDYASGKCFFPRLPTPTRSQIVKLAESIELPEGAEWLDSSRGVFIEPFLARQLRVHQLQGVRFMYECLSGAKGDGIQGCILADSMGLGKTLQAITLFYTMTKAFGDYKPLASKVIIVTPASLVLNWDKEIKKWLGPKRLGVMCCQGSRKETEAGIKMFCSSRYPCLIISYETFRTHAERLKAACELVICDEGHRIKNEKTLTAESLSGLTCIRRVLLTGTPLQNSLGEFYACVNFVNPGILGTPYAFNTVYAEPILRGQDSEADDDTKALAWARSEELSHITTKFVLRRTGELLESLLPPRYEYLIFCKISPLQSSLYQALLAAYFSEKHITEMKASNVLTLIAYLRRIICHPDLLWKNPPTNPDVAAAWKQIKQVFPVDYEGLTDRISLSTKLSFLAKIIEEARKVGDGTVVVSNFTKTLDIVEDYCRELGIAYLRLDGSTSVASRMTLIDQFNSGRSSVPVFLLSTKAGGCGLNLIGGNRMVLLDPDWNPSNDKQAMGRIWRDGQLKPVYIYRLFCAGTLEEKIFQRQSCKERLSTVVVDKKKIAASFSLEFLNELFTLRETCQSFAPEDSHPLDMPEFANSFVDKLADFIEVIRVNDPLNAVESNVAEEKLEFTDSVLHDLKRPRSEDDEIPCKKAKEAN